MHTKPQGPLSKLPTNVVKLWYQWRNGCICAMLQSAPYCRIELTELHRFKCELFGSLAVIQQVSNRSKRCWAPVTCTLLSGRMCLSYWKSEWLLSTEVDSWWAVPRNSNSVISLQPQNNFKTHPVHFLIFVLQWLVTFFMNRPHICRGKVDILKVFVIY